MLSVCLNTAGLVSKPHAAMTAATAPGPNGAAMASSRFSKSVFTKVSDAVTLTERGLNVNGGWGVPELYHPSYRNSYGLMTYEALGTELPLCFHVKSTV